MYTGNVRDVNVVDERCFADLGMMPREEKDVK